MKIGTLLFQNVSCDPMIPLKTKNKIEMSRRNVFQKENTWARTSPI